jgi:hypothetical protein
MNETSWWAGTDPVEMLRLLPRLPLAFGPRQVRLFACACCRLAWHLLSEPSRAAVVVGERFADGEASPGERGRAAEEAKRARLGARGAGWYAAHAVEQALSQPCGLERAAVAARAAQAALADPGDVEAQAREQARQAALLRDLVAPGPVRLAPAWLAWGDRTVVALARALAADGAFAELPVLADALEEAGCDSAYLLGHLRAAGPHARGCWALELCVARE